jgi:hypothetical protein
MKKLLFTLIAGFALTVNLSTANAQAYKTGVGLNIDLGDGGTFVGPHIKHFFNTNSAIEGDVLFGSGSTVIQALYQYNAPIKGAAGLIWYIGAGPGIQLYTGGSTFLIRPVTGLDYKIAQAPLAVSFDWRPFFAIYDGGSNFTAARFGLSFKYTF